MFWVGDTLVLIGNDIIHRLTSLCNEGCNLVSEKNVKRFIEKNLKSKSDGRNMKIDLINKFDVSMASKVIRYKMNYNSKVNLVPIGFIHVSYPITTKRQKVNMCEILKQKLSDNIEKLKKTKSTLFRLEGLLTHLFFKVIRKFPSMLDKIWDNNQCTMNLVTHYYHKHPKENITIDIARLIKSFEVAMKQRYIIPPTLVDKYSNDICFIVEIGVTFMEAIEPRVIFIDHMGYEMSEDLIEGYAKIIHESKKDVDYPRWGNIRKR